MAETKECGGDRIFQKEPPERKMRKGKTEQLEKVTVEELPEGVVRLLKAITVTQLEVRTMVKGKGQEG